MKENSISILNFNSQPHEEADEEKADSKAIQRYFNSQPHEEADGGVKTARTMSQYFNSQPHEEADFDGMSVQSCTLSFQLTASRRG